MSAFPFLRVSLFLIIFYCITSYAKELRDPLPSWRDGLNKQQIIQFVTQVTNKKSINYVPPEDRIATFDNDGTLWVEQPIYTQVIFAIDRIKTLTPQHPEWKNREPFKSILNNQYQHLTIQEVERILALTHSGMTVEAFNHMIETWLAHTKNPRFKRLYTELIYQPMLEVINYLRENSFNIYIVSGGGQDFIRAYSNKTYQISVEHIIGSATKTKYTEQHGKPELIKIPELFLIDDKQGKPIGIHLFIGKKPIIAFGNSTGDQQMLEWTQSGTGKRLMILVHHDDAKREYAYDTQSKIGTFSQALMNEAKKNQWLIVSMKNDWLVIFPFEKNQSLKKIRKKLK